jgi:hypothetical protein
MQVPKDEGSARLDGVAAVDVKVPAKGCEARTPPRLRRRSERTGGELVRAERARVEGVEVVELPACRGSRRSRRAHGVEPGRKLCMGGGDRACLHSDRPQTRIVQNGLSWAEPGRESDPRRNPMEQKSFPACECVRVCWSECVCISVRLRVCVSLCAFFCVCVVVVGRSRALARRCASAPATPLSPPNTYANPPAAAKPCPFRAAGTTPWRDRLR